MVTQASNRSAVAGALIFCLSCIGLMIFVWTQFAGTIPFAPTGYQVKGLFPETGQLVPGADVRISGVNVGKVTAVQPEGVDSLVSMNLNREYAPIPADTHSIVRLKTLLGEAYVELSTGNRTGPMLRDGGTIPSSQVEPTVGLDQVLDAFTPSTQQALQNFLDGTFTALSGRGQEINNALGNLDPTVTELAAVVGVLNEQSGNVQSVVRNLGSVLATLGGRSAALQTLVTAGDQVLSATASRNVALTATVDALPPFLARLRTTLTDLNTTLTIAKPTLDVVQNAAPLVRPALSDLISLSGPAVSLLHEAPTLVREADVALPAITRFTVAFDHVLNPVLQAAKQIVPTINFIKQYKSSVIAGMANLAATTNASSPASTGTAKYFRAALALNDTALFGQTEAPSDARLNPYPSPGEMSNINHGGLESASCGNVGNTTLPELLLGDPLIADVLPIGSNVPCRIEPKYAWKATPSTPLSYYPHVTALP
jgi:phospholipid/cholesterol/gamma-HCH transport system substrate-binding protein